MLIPPRVGRVWNGGDTGDVADGYARPSGNPPTGVCAPEEYTGKDAVLDKDTKLFPGMDAASETAVPGFLCPFDRPGCAMGSKFGPRTGRRASGGAS